MSGTNKGNDSDCQGVAEPVRLLVIVGDPRERSAVLGTLRASWPDAEAAGVATRQDALARLSTGEFDVCLIDLDLPDGGAWQIGNWLHERGRDERVVFLGSESMLRDGSLQAGFEAAELVAKSARPGLLLETSVRRALEYRRRALESRELERRVARAEELASLNTLLAGIAHNLNNPLTTIRTFLELLPERYESDPEFRGDYYQLVLAELQRIRDLIRSVAQTIAIPASEEGRRWSLPELLSELEVYVHGGASEKGVSVQVRTEGDFEPVPAEREAIKQALVILLDNAVAFSPERGCV